MELCGNECSNSDVSRELRQERQMENMDKTSSAPKSYSTLLIHKDLIIDLLHNNNYIMIEASRLASLFPAWGGSAQVNWVGDSSPS